MNSIYTASEENRLAAAAMARARHLRALAPTEFWSMVGGWVGNAAARITRGLLHCRRSAGAARAQAKWSKEA